jgi:hypothetical protein
MILPRACSYLPENHPLRTDPTFGAACPYCDNPPPEPRNHTTAMAQAKEAEEYYGPKEAHPRKRTGINHVSPLSKLHLFDMIWDVCPDMMHVTKNFGTKILEGVLGGTRSPDWSTRKNPVPKPDGRDYERRRAKYDAEVLRWRESTTKNQTCTFTPEEQHLVDTRIQDLVGPSRWIRRTMVFSV